MKRIKKIFDWKEFILFGCFVLCFLALQNGCSIWNDHKDEVFQKLIEYAENDGEQKVVEYIDQLVQDGRLGSSNADKLKKALKQGLGKFKQEVEEMENKK